MLGITALVMVGLAGVTLWARTASPIVDGELSIPGAPGVIEIGRDSLGVPHIWASDEASMLFAQGWVHAQDRLWQMELLRRVAEGRLAEVLGPDLLSTDRYLRTAGIWRHAGRQEEVLSPRARRRLEAYAAGVNAWLVSNHKALPPEFLLLRVRPEPWTVRHSLALEKIMAWDLSAYDQTQRMAGATRVLPPDRHDYLLPGYADWAPTIIAPPPVPERASRLIEAGSVTRASNAWVIGGSRTRSGKPILANDMHLALTAPAIWYLMALHSDQLDVVGMTQPGWPYVVAGHNRAVAWGFTNAMVDDTDFFMERVDPSDPSLYLVADGSEPFELIRERIAVRGADTVDMEIRLTRHGPVLDEVEESAEGHVLSMAWAASTPSTTFAGVRLLNMATSAADVVAAVTMLDNPHQNVVFADTAGRYGYRMSGRIPVRGSGRLPPVAPVPGWTGDWDWSGYMPPDAHPSTIDPPAGYVVTANNRQVAGDVGDRITRIWEPPYRAVRIGQMIEGSGPLDAAAVHAMQLDVRDAFAEHHVGMAVAAARRAGDSTAVMTLSSWDLQAERASTGAALFYVWIEELRERVSADLYNGANGWLPRNTFHAVLDSAALPWRGPQAVTAFDSIASEAMTTASKVAGARTWGDLHRIVAPHALSAVPLVARLLGLDIGPAPGDGSNTTVNVSRYGGRPPLDADYGASQRHVVDMGDLDGAGGFILPTGQSGIPFDEHYRDQFERWLDGGLWRVPLDRERAAARIVHRLILRPAER